jgi:hypothetical protein
MLLAICKKITDILPFENRNRVILRDKELIKHLLLVLPFIQTTAEMIIESLITKFISEPEFVHSFQLSLEKVASLTDPKNRKNSPAEEDLFDSSPTQFKSALELGLVSTSHSDTPELINSSLETIKKMSFQQAKLFYGHFEWYAKKKNMKNLEDESQTISPFTFVQLLIQSTPNPEFLKEVETWYSQLALNPFWSIDNSYKVYLDWGKPIILIFFIKGFRICKEKPKWQSIWIGRTAKLWELCVREPTTAKKRKKQRQEESGLRGEFE